MLRAVLTATVLIWAGRVCGDDPKAPKPPAVKADPKPIPAFVAEFEAIKKEADAEQHKLSAAVMKEQKEAKTEDERQAVMIRASRENVRTMTPVAERVLAAVRPHAADPAAVEALVWVVNHSMDGAGDEAAGLLMKYHLTCEQTVKLAVRHRRDPHRWTEPMLRSQLAAADLPPADRPRVLRTLAQVKQTLCEFRSGLSRSTDEQWALMEELYGKEWMVELRKADPAKEEAEAIRLYTALGEKYGSEKDVRDRTYGDLAKAALFEIRHLSVGKPAPEIDGEDTDGARLKLSDFRGKVVVLTFWGTWCGPCMAMVPHETEIAERMKGRPFAIVGVNSDADWSTVKEKAGKAGVTWRSFWCGEKGPAGAIPMAWNVVGWPTVYVLDHKGVIRAKQVRGKALDRALDPLVKEAEASP